jgi:hypothetical protein
MKEPPVAKPVTIPADTEAAKLRIKAFGIAPDASSQSYLQQRVGGKLGKFASQIRGLEIHMKRMGWSGNDPRVSCALSLTLDGGGTLAVERSALGAREAFDHAMGVAERLVRHTLQRLRHR